MGSALKPIAETVQHTLTGNCSADEVIFDANGGLLDACPEHDEPRGECSECGPCPACELEGLS